MAGFLGQHLFEGGRIGLLQLQHQSRRLAVGGIKHGGAGDLHRPGQVEDDSGAARHHQTVSECLDQPSAGCPGAGRQAEIDLGNINDQPVGIGHGKGPKRDGLVEIEDESGLPGIARKSRIGRDRIGRSRSRNLCLLLGADQSEARAQQCCAAQQCAAQQNPMICAARHRFLRLRSGPSTPIEPQG
jgi:hypothetical protein